MPSVSAALRGARASAGRGSRRRRTTAWPTVRWTALILVALVVGAGVAYGIDRLVTDPRLAVTGVDVVGVKMTSPDAVRNAAGFPLGANVWLLNVAAAQERIDRLPWVKVATVERSWPNGLRVSVSERTPVAAVVLPAQPGAEEPDGRLALVDASMRVLAVGDAGFTTSSLPTLRIDPAPSGIVAGADFSGSDVERAYDVLEQVRALGMQVTEVGVAPDFGESIVTDRGLHALFGSDDDLAAKVSLLREIEPRITSPRDVIYVDLRSTRAPTVLYR
jgi:cell division protein FtsQ